MKGHSAQGQIMNIIIKHIFIYSFHFYLSMFIINIDNDMLRRRKWNSYFSNCKCLPMILKGKTSKSGVAVTI